MYFRRRCHWRCFSSFAAVWLFWLTFVSIQQNRLHGDGCSWAAQQQSKQITHNHLPLKQLQTSNNCNEQQLTKTAVIGLPVLKLGEKSEKATKTSAMVTVTTTPRQVVGDVVTEAAEIMPTQLDKQQEMPAAAPSEVDSESDERLVTEENNNEVPITKPYADINGSNSKSTRSISVAKEAGNIDSSKVNATKSINEAKATTATKQMQTKEGEAPLQMAATTVTITTPIPSAGRNSFTTVSSQAKRLIARNLKQSKNVVNSDYLAYDFKANVAKLFANDAAAGRMANASYASINDEFKNNIRSRELLRKIERESNNSSSSSSNGNHNNESNGVHNNKQTTTATTPNNRSNNNKKSVNQNHIENNYNPNNLSPVEQPHPSSVSGAKAAAAVALSSNFAVDTIVEPTAAGSGNTNRYNSSKNNNNKTNFHNKYNKVVHTNERRHIVPEKLQYTKELNIKQGRLMGITRNFQSSTGLRDVDQYLGLPYAEAPVGSRRFMPPGAPLPWQGLKIARHLPPVCPQQLPDVTAHGSVKMSRGRYKHLARLLPYLKTESEDCLYLNLYVPRSDGAFDSSSAYDMDSSAKRLPVMVYVHGESFEWNSGNPYDGSVLASYGQVIVVTINYRLGVMGFLKPSIDENTVANFGLLDQIAALHWIKENIASFGGDKDSVTLMGHSTGAACVNYLMISPVASGLFHRAILMSGSAMSDWAASNHSLQLTMQIAHTLNCPLNDDNEEMLSCLRQKRYQEILKIPTSFPQFSTSLGPIVDGHVIPNQPYKVMGQYTEHFSRYDLLFGVTESESYHTLGALALDEGLRENERDNLLRFYMQTRFDVRPDLALAATLKKYEDMYNNPIKATNLEHRDVVLDILSDARVVGPLLQTGLFHADVNRRNYMYVFGHNSATGPHASLPHSITGEELAFIFGAPLAPAGPFPSNSYGVQEKLLSEAVMTYWTNFAKTGNPKAPWKGSFINLHALEWDRYDLDWPEFNKRSQAYMNIGIPPSIGYKYRHIYMNFWNKELPDELNQIANIQRQPYLHATVYDGADGAIASQRPRDGTATAMHRTYPLQRHGIGGGSEVITGHMSQFGTRDNGAEDPVRTLKLLLQEPWKLGGSNEGANANGGGVVGMDTLAENMYNAPPTFGVTKTADDEQHYRMAATGVMGGGMIAVSGGGSVGDGVAATNGLGGFTGLGVGTGVALAGGGNAIYGVPKTEITEDESGFGDGSGGNGGAGDDAGSAAGAVGNAGNKEEVAKSETTIQLLIGLIAVFIVLNVIIYSTFLLQKKKKAHNMQRKLGGILSYDGTTDDEFKRSKQNDGDDSYILDIVRKSNTYEAVKTERSPINGFQMTRQLSTSTVDTHTKVCAWMSAAAGAAAEVKACANGGTDSSKSGSKKSSSPTFSSLRSSSAGGSFKQPKAPQKVSVAVDATPQARSSSILEQEPIEVLKLKADGRNIIICQEVEVVDQELLTPQNSLDSSRYTLVRQHSAATEPCEAELPQQGQLPVYKPTPQHAHSHSDPVDMQQYYSNICGATERDEKVTSFVDEDINVTSRDDDEVSADALAGVRLTHAQQLQVIKSRNYPKVLPTIKTTPNSGVPLHTNADDSPPMTLDLRTTNKRNSLPPNSFLPHFSGTTGASGIVGGRYPPLPPPRTISTLGRKPSQRRNSNNITTSPLMLAHDCTAEEEEEPPITQNTLIVGPLIPQQKQLAIGAETGVGGADANYSTLRRNGATTAAKAVFNSLSGNRADDATSKARKTTTTTTAMHNISGASLTPTSTQIGSKSATATAGVAGVTTFLSSGGCAGLQSFESRPISVSKEDELQQQRSEQQQQHTHHTERVYAIQQPTNLPPMRTGSQAIAGVATPPTTAATATPTTLITPTLMNLTGHQSGSVHNNMLPTGSSNNNINKNVAINAGITDIYAQPNKLAIKAKANLTASKLNAPTVEQSTTKAAITNHSTTTLPKSPSIGAIPIAADEVAKANQLTIATAPTTTPTAEITCRLGAKELTNSDIDKQVTAMGGMQTMDAMAAAAAATTTTKTTIAAHTAQTAKYISATVGKGGDVAALPHMPQVLRDASVGSLQAQLESQQQVQPQQKEIPATLKSIPAETETTKITETAATFTRVPVTCMSATPATTTTTPTTTTPNATRTIANAIAAQLAQTKPLKAALASSRAAMANTTSTFAGNDSRAVTARDSCHSSVSACSTGSRTSSTCSTSSESTTSSNASTATDTSSNSSSSSTGTVRTELQQK
ncbi:uncharacterized protein LOC129252881 [Anastrepha obliqua]|uniref:uncharacterized protein LOC129252881 n=1 Tax=Anastrepha obliqua TaxID=95512 RepID=UPI0024093DAA|nr:uncharacterized protein LOC129252881 [Anastrepha obliqua]